MSWIKLEDASQLNTIKEESNEKPVVIFKHSTSCSISGMAWNRLQRNWKDGDSEKFTPYYLDLLSYRALSNAIAEEFNVTHASPQVIVVLPPVASTKVLPIIFSVESLTGKGWKSSL